MAKNRGVIMKKQILKRDGFTLLEIALVLLIMAIMASLAIPSYRGATNLIKNASCYLNQRHIRDAVLVYYTDRPFVNRNDGFGDGEVFIDLTGRVVGDPNRNLSGLIDNPGVFDCPSDGIAANGDTTPDYLTDGYMVTCLTDDATGLKSDGVAFVHDTARDVVWKHNGLTSVALGQAVPGPSPQPTPEPIPEPAPEPTPVPIPEPTPVPPVPAVLFSDDFGLDSADSWLTKYADYFTFSDGYLTLGGKDAGKGQNRMFTGEEDWKDYSIDTVAMLNSGDGYNIYFRSSDPNNTDGYVFQYNEKFGSGAFLLRKIENGKEQEPFAKVYVRDTKFGKGFPWYDTEHKIRVEVAGNEYRAYVDGELVVVGSDDSYPSGMVGLGTWSTGIATFDNFTVTGP
jgi:prepilin-type N-terminal cleavage/methylation domain-containing protein